MNLFRNLFIFILVLKLVVSNGDMEKDTEKAVNSDQQANGNVKMPELEKIGSKTKTSTNPVNQIGNKSVPVENSVKSDTQESDQALKSNSQPSTKVKAPPPHISSKTIDSKPNLSSEEPGSDSNSDEEHYKTFRDKNAQILFPNTKPSTERNSDSDDLPTAKVKENQPETISIKSQQNSTTLAINIEEDSDQQSGVTNSKSVTNVHEQHKVSTTTAPSSHDPPKIVQNDLDTKDGSKQNTHKPVIVPNRENTGGSKTHPNNPSVSPPDKLDGIADFDSQRTEKSLRMDATDNINSLADPTSTGLQEKGSNQNSNAGEREITEKKESDVVPVLKNTSMEVTETTSTPSGLNTATTLGNITPQINLANFSKPTLPTTKLYEQPPSASTIEELGTESPSRDSAAMTPSSPRFTTKFFRTVNSTDEVDNGTDENDSDSRENNNGKIVVTDKTLVGQPIMEDTDLTTVGHDVNLTENSPNTFMTDDDTMQGGNATSANSGKNSDPKMVFPDNITSPATPTESPITEIGMKENEPYSSETPTSTTPDSTKSTTPASNSTEWTNATGMPPVNTTANNDITTMTIQQFFSQLKIHTVLCVISIALIVLTLTVIVSLLLVIYYLCKYVMIALISLCRRMGGCGKRKKNLGSIPEGSLFPRCDVNVSPYVQNASLRNSRNGLDTEMYS